MVYSRPLVSEQGQELGHSVILVHLDIQSKPPQKNTGGKKQEFVLFIKEILSCFSCQK